MAETTRPGDDEPEDQHPTPTPDPKPAVAEGGTVERDAEDEADDDHNEDG